MSCGLFFNYARLGHFLLIAWKIILDITIDDRKKATEIQIGASSLVASRYVMSNIPAP